MLTFSNYEFYHIDHDSERIKGIFSRSVSRECVNQNEVLVLKERKYACVTNIICYFHEKITSVKVLPVV